MTKQIRDPPAIPAKSPVSIDVAPAPRVHFRSRKYDTHITARRARRAGTKIAVQSLMLGKRDERNGPQQSDGQAGWAQTGPRMYANRNVIWCQRRDQ